MKGLYIKKLTKYIDKNFNNNKEDKEAVSIAAINEFIMYTQEGYSERDAYAKTINEIDVDEKYKVRFKFEKEVLILAGLIFALATYIGLIIQKSMIFSITNIICLAVFMLIIGFKFGFKTISKSKYVIALTNSVICLDILALLSDNRIIFNGYLVACLAILLINYYFFVNKKPWNFLKSGLLLTYTVGVVFNNADFTNNPFLLTIGIVILVALISINIYEAVSEIDYKFQMNFKISVSAIYFILSGLLLTIKADYLVYQIVFFLSLLLMIIIFYITFFNKKLYIRSGYFNSIVVGNGFLTIAMLLKLYNSYSGGTGSFYFGLILITSIILADLLDNLEKNNVIVEPINN